MRFSAFARSAAPNFSQNLFRSSAIDKAAWLTVFSTLVVQYQNRRWLQFFCCLVIISSHARNCFFTQVLLPIDGIYIDWATDVAASLSWFRVDCGIGRYLWDIILRSYKFRSATSSINYSRVASLKPHLEKQLRIASFITFLQASITLLIDFKRSTLLVTSDALDPGLTLASTCCGSCLR